MKKEYFLYGLIVVITIAILYYVFKPTKITKSEIAGGQGGSAPPPATQPSETPYTVTPKPSPPPVTSTGNTQGLNLAKQLNTGSKGAEVVALQKLLMSNGYSLPKYGSDGSYGSETKTAHDAFLKSVNGTDRSLGFAQQKINNVISSLMGGSGQVWQQGQPIDWWLYYTDTTYFNSVPQGTFWQGWF